MSDDNQAGWLKLYRGLLDNERRPFLPNEISDLTVPQFILVLGPPLTDEQMLAWLEG